MVCLSAEGVNGAGAATWAPRHAEKRGSLQAIDRGFPWKFGGNPKLTATVRGTYIGAMIAAGFVHNINPVMATVFGVPLYYYGLAYSLGFFGVYCWFAVRRKRLGWSYEEVVQMSALFSAGALAGGRALAISVYQWQYYGQHLDQLFSFWRGGMASHGVLIGAFVGSWLFCRLRKKSLLTVMDEVVIPGAVFLALGRIGNFMNGMIVGTVTDVWWAVKFPTAEGFRHPVTLYESAKNFAVAAILLWVRRKSRPGQGRLLAHFVLWYGLLRIPIDIFRDHGKSFLGVGVNQYFNAMMAIAGAVMLLVFAARARRGVRQPAAPPGPPRDAAWRLWISRACFIGILLLSLTIPCAWTRGSLPRFSDAPQSKPVIQESRIERPSPRPYDYAHAEGSHENTRHVPGRGRRQRSSLR